LPALELDFQSARRARESNESASVSGGHVRNQQLCKCLAVAANRPEFLVFRWRPFVPQTETFSSLRNPTPERGILVHDHSFQESRMHSRISNDTSQ
jgi:hypothetical protein